MLGLTSPVDPLANCGKSPEDKLPLGPLSLAFQASPTGFWPPRGRWREGGHPLLGGGTRHSTG